MVTKEMRGGKKKEIDNYVYFAVPFVGSSGARLSIARKSAPVLPAAKKKWRNCKR
jgi:hypothetical protein